jgi:hypothetical protein
MQPIKGLGFRGMNNLETAPGILLDDAKRITPKIALNVEVLDGGKLVRRQGYSLEIPLPGVHSLWADSVMLCVASGILYRIEGSTAMALCPVAGPQATVCYSELDSLVYMATPSWEAVYDLLRGQVRPWGLSLPPAPSFSLVGGDMPPGAYSFCYTRSDGDQLSGNGQIARVSWEGGTQGIQLDNLPTGGQCWITQPNGTDLFLSSLDFDGTPKIIAPTVVPLPTFQVAPPSGMSYFAQAFGRIWACKGKKLIYSDPFQYEWFRTQNFKPFLEDLIMVAPVTDGLFVGSKKSTWFLDGTDPAKMVLKRIGDGVVPGTLVYAELPGAVVGGGYEMSRRLSQIPSPAWIGKHGVVIGTQTGHLVHLTESRLRMSIRSQGGSLFRVKKGVPQIITVLSGPLQDEEMETEANVFKDGQLFD